jgi:predicted enzyme related to lactoylglutathione lyase
MSERSEYAPGEFCWVDLSTPDVEAATKFYGELLGVERQAAPGPPEETGGYGFLVKDGKQIAGISPIMSEGQPPAWSGYVKVADADQTVAKVRDAGGRVLFDPIDIPNESGRMAVFADPQGAVFSVMQQKQHQGAQLVNEPGSWTWNNLMTSDVDGAKKFYGEVFGWKADQNEEAPPNVLMWQVEGQRWPEGLGGLMAMGSDIPSGTPPHWQVYFAVDDADGAIEKTRSAGGSLLFGPLDVPVGRLAVLGDPQGANVAIIESRYPDPR